jgi:hypothetical protein
VTVEQEVERLHQGELTQVRSGYWVVQCDCYWSTARYLDPGDAWAQHESHKRGQAEAKRLRQQLGTDDRYEREIAAIRRRHDRQ